MLQITWLQPCLEQHSMQARVLAGIERNQDVMDDKVLPAIFSPPVIFRSEGPLLPRTIRCLYKLKRSSVLSGRYRL